MKSHQSDAKRYAADQLKRLTDLTERVEAYIAEHGAHLPRCCNHGCEYIAQVVAYWPGQTSPMCEVHAGAATRIAEAMGFELRREAIPETARFIDELRAEFEHPSSVRFSLLEMD